MRVALSLAAGKNDSYMIVVLVPAWVNASLFLKQTKYTRLLYTSDVQT